MLMPAGVTVGYSVLFAPYYAVFLLALTLIFLFDAMATNDLIQDQNHDVEEETNSNQSIEPQEKDNEIKEAASENGDEDEDLEEGELKDDDEDDEDDDGPPPSQTNHHTQDAGQAANYPRNSGPVEARPPSGSTSSSSYKVNIRCRFYSKTSNKCTWGDHCRFEHRDDSPSPEFDPRAPSGAGPGSSRGPPPPPMGAAERGPYPPYAGRHQHYPPPPPPHGYSYDPYGHHSTPPPPPPMGVGERGQCPPYTGRHQPYPPPPPPHHGYPYDAYGHHSTPPRLPPHSMSHWRQQHSPYPSPSSGHPPESVSPALILNPGGGGGGSSNAVGSRGPPAPPGSSGGSGSSGGGGPSAVGGAPSPGYPSTAPSSAVVYERKHRLAYELAPWNDRGYPPPSKYDRGDPSGYPSGRGFYRNQYSREPPYGREPQFHMGGPYPGYPTYPSAHRAGPMGPHASHFKFMSSSQRNVPPDTRRSRSNKRGHDEDESSWSDSGSEDSILGQANYSSTKCHATKISKQQPTENATSDEPLEQGSGTPPGEPLPEDRERQEMLLNKLKEIEDLMAKKKGEQEDPM